MFSCGGRSLLFAFLSREAPECYTTTLNFRIVFHAHPMSQPDRSSRTPFPATHWTLIRRVQSGNGADASRAMEEICRQYWYPTYAFARRYGFSPHHSEDLFGRNGMDALIGLFRSMAVRSALPSLFLAAAFF